MSEAREVMTSLDGFQRRWLALVSPILCFRSGFAALPNPEGDQRCCRLVSALCFDCDQVVVAHAETELNVDLIDTVGDLGDRQRPKFFSSTVEQPRGGRDVLSAINGEADKKSIQSIEFTTRLGLPFASLGDG